MAYEEDIKNKSLLDWLKAHTTGFKPLHRYNGTLELNGKVLIFRGKDVKKNTPFYLEIPLKDIVDVYYGFDEIFRRRDERFPWNKPLRIKFRQNGIKTVYLFANFRNRRGIRTSDNAELYKKLEEIMEA